MVASDARLADAVNKMGYRLARLDAERETGLAQESFPETCPFSFEDIMRQDFWPD
jgi:hypothetical protein